MLGGGTQQNKKRSNNNMENGTCRVCMEDCSEQLKCKCSGYAHGTCMREWMRARIQRGDTLEDARHCELCLARSTPAAGVFSGVRFRILMTRLVFVLLLLAIAVESFTAMVMSQGWNGGMGVFVIVIMFVIFLITRVFTDSLCVNACLCRDLEDDDDD